MCETAQYGGEFFAAVGFLNYFSDLTDGRQAGNVVYPLDKVLLLAVLAGAETFASAGASCSARSKCGWKVQRYHSDPQASADACH